MGASRRNGAFERVRVAAAQVLALRRSAWDWLFVPLAAQWIVLNEFVYPGYTIYLFRMGTFQNHANVIFPITWGSALALFLLAGLQFRFRYRLDYVRSVVYALGLVLAATSLFEMIYQNVGSGLGIGNQQLFGQAINVSSIAMALCSVRYWQPTRLVLLVAVLYLFGWLVWLSLGYPQIYDPDPHRAMEAFDLNAVLKFGAYALMGLLVTRLPISEAGRSSAPVAGARGDDT